MDQTSYLFPQIAFLNPRKHPLFELLTKLLYFGRSPDTSNYVDLKPLFVTPALSGFLVTTPDNSLALTGGKFFLASRWRRPERLRLICYRSLSAKTPALQIQRLCGLPGDVVQIKAGILHINGLNADKTLQLMHIFKVHLKDKDTIHYDPRQAYTVPPYSDILYITLTDTYAGDQPAVCEKYLLPPGLRDDTIFSVYRKNWNRDNFGPVKIPAGKWFVLGDNRGKAIDSRHLGFVDSSKFIGGIL